MCGIDIYVLSLCSKQSIESMKHVTLCSMKVQCLSRKENMYNSKNSYCKQINI